ncbi:PREDICTED: UPF0740 protein C1orf192 homolog [Pygoscelis adeliae]|uniref:UPF0740 protein C1orf192 homolog n=1 Tax=Pygoscelis adeliae TaxID=9238 RepID=UPI0004F4E7E8|nr:PREDICTED: UPF0740 protein C1orf192 homolog [Pygoscelis adeliae]
MEQLLAPGSVWNPLGGAAELAGAVVVWKAPAWPSCAAGHCTAAEHPYPQLLPSVPSSRVSPWGRFVGAWERPPRIPPARLDLTARSDAAAAQLIDWIHQPTALTHACNGLRTEITGRVSIKSPMRRADVPHKADILPADDVNGKEDPS